MVLSDLVHQNSVNADLRSRDMKGVFSEILDALTAARRIQDKQGVLHALLERESQGSTGIGSGVAVPHARIEGLSEPVLFIGVSKEGIDFASFDKQPVRIVMLLLAPASDIGKGLKILAAIARLVNDRYFTNRITQASSSDELYVILKQSVDGREVPVADSARGY